MILITCLFYVWTGTSFILTFWPSIFTPFMVLALLWESCFVCIYTVCLFGKELEPSHEIRVQMLMLGPLWCFPLCFVDFEPKLFLNSHHLVVDQVVVFSKLLLSFKTSNLKEVSSQWETTLLRCEAVTFLYCGEWGKMCQFINFSWHTLQKNGFLT